MSVLDDCGCQDNTEQFADRNPGDGRKGGNIAALIRYWTSGEGRAKIGWGKPCDFCSCLSQLRKYVPARMLKGFCARLHKRALGVWPGQEHRSRDKGAGCPC